MTPGQLAQLACVLEATARKPGNVHPDARFADASYADFVASAIAIGPALDQASTQGVGRAVWLAVEATQRVAPSNTNLGMILLLAPLAAVPADRAIAGADGVESVLARLTVDDAQQVYAAIRLARPGGLGRVPEQDVDQEPTMPLRPIMALAASRDGIARQYANGYADVLGVGMPALVEWLDRSGSLERAIIGCALTMLAELGDGLIGRKCGEAVAVEASQRARAALARGAPLRPEPLAELDRWLRVDGHRRNPGTTADLVTATLYVWLRERGPCPLPPW